MPLSEHEQRLLEQLERQLHEDDPKFATSMERGHGQSFSARRIIIGVLAGVVGVMVLVGGVNLHNILLGVLGFVIMGAGTYYAISKGKNGSTASSGAKGPGKNRGGAAAKSGFMSDLEQRWEERRRQDP